MTVNASLQGMDAHTVSLTFILTVVHIDYRTPFILLSLIFAQVPMSVLLDIV